MGNFKRDLQREQIAHAETKQLVEGLRQRIQELESLQPIEKVVTKVVTKEVPVEKIRYVKVPDLSQVTEEEIKRAYEGIAK